MTTLSGHHDRTIFSVDWSRDGVIATGTIDAEVLLFLVAAPFPAACGAVRHVQLQLDAQCSALDRNVRY